MWERPSGSEGARGQEQKVSQNGLVHWTLNLRALPPQDCRTHLLLCILRLPASVCELQHCFPRTESPQTRVQPPKFCRLQKAHGRPSAAATVTSLVSLLFSAYTGSIGSVSGESHRPSNHGRPARGCQFVSELTLTCKRGWGRPGWVPRHTFYLRKETESSPAGHPTNTL